MKTPTVEEIHTDLQIHRRLRQNFQKFVSKKSPQLVWEVGALDGQDSVKLKKEFPSSNFIAFEPTPYSFKSVSRNLKLIGGQAFQMAISDRDGYVNFMVNDPNKTLTTWENGNQGANSLFKANPNYPVEKYFQNTISVKTSRADSLFAEGFSVPELIWVDAQGSELMILESFGEKLQLVDFIYIELSIFPIYTEAPLAIEVVQYLAQKGFYWTTNLTRGGYQFDGVFIRPKKLKTWARIKHIFFVYSLNTTDKLFISLNLTQFIKGRIKGFLIKFKLFTVDNHK